MNLVSRPWSLVPVLAVLALASACGRKDAPPQLRPSEESGPVQVSAAAATARQVPVTIDVTGTLVGGQQSELTPLVAGRVTEVMVERGSVVREGDPLMRLRDVDYRTSAEAAQAMADQARARLGIGADGRFDPASAPEVRAAQANRDVAVDALARAEQLAQSGAMSAQELERAQAQARAAREQYQSALNGARAAYHGLQGARVQATQARRAVADSVVRAPFAGEVAERRANIGEYVTPQRAIAVLVQTDPLRIELAVPQEFVAQVRTGQGVDFRVDAFRDRVFRGTVRYISAAVTRASRSLVVEAVVPNPDGALRPGLFATAHIELGRQRTLVAVPARAVLTEAGTSRVFVVNSNNRIEEHVIAVAERSGDTVLVERGLRGGERVATEALERLGDNTPVQVR